MSTNLSALNAYITAQKKAVSTTDMDQFKDALLSANEALYSIEDPALRKRIKEAGGEFEKLTKILKAYRIEQMKELLLKKGVVGVEEARTKNIVISSKTLMAGPDDPMYNAALEQLANKHLGALARYVAETRPTDEGRRDVNDALVKILKQPFKSAMAARLPYGQFAADPVLGMTAGGADVRGKLMSAKDKEGKAIFDATEVKEFTDLIATGLDPGLIFQNETSQKLLDWIRSGGFMGQIMEHVDEDTKRLIEEMNRQKVLANFTEALSAMYKQIDDSIIDRADIARRMGTNLARRAQRLGARGSMLGKAMDPMDLARERLTAGMANVGAKRGLMGGEMVTAYGSKLGKLLQEIAAGAQEELESLTQKIMVPFLEGKFPEAMTTLDLERTRKIAVPGAVPGGGFEAPRLNTKQMKSIVDFNRSLREGIGKSAEALRKQELLLKDKFREDQVRAEILKAERDIQLQKTDYLHQLELALATEEAVVSGRLNALSLMESDPRLTRFKGPAAKQKFAGDIATEKLGIQQGLATDKLKLQIETERAAIVAQHLLNTSTQKLTESNFSLMAVLRLQLAALDKPESQVKRFAEIMASSQKEGTKSVLNEVKKFTDMITPGGVPVVINETLIPEFQGVVKGAFPKPSEAEQDLINKAQRSMELHDYGVRRPSDTRPGGSISPADRVKSQLDRRDAAMVEEQMQRSAEAHDTRGPSKGGGALLSKPIDWDPSRFLAEETLDQKEKREYYNQMAGQRMLTGKEAAQRGRGELPEITGARMPSANLKSLTTKLKAREEEERRVTDAVAGKRGTLTKAARKEAVLRLQELKPEVIALRKKVKAGSDEVVLAEGVAGKGQVVPAVQQIAKEVEGEKAIVQLEEKKHNLAQALTGLSADELLAQGLITKEIHQQLKMWEKTADKRLKAHGISQAQEKANLAAQNRFNSGLVESQTKFTEGLKDGLGAVYTDSEGLMNRLGKTLPMTFRDNMVSAMEDVMDKTKDFDDALRGVAISFLKEMRRAFLTQGVSSLMNAITAGTVSGAATQMRPRPGFQSGRMVPGGGTGDTVPAMLEPGEFVVNREAAKNNLPMLNSLNFEEYPRFAQKGGMTPKNNNVWDLGLGFTVPRTDRRKGPKRDVKRALKSGHISARQAFQFRKGFGILDGFWITGKAGADISFPRTSAVGNLPRDAKKAFGQGIINSQEYRIVRQIHGFQGGGAARLDAPLGSTLAEHRKRGGADPSGFLWMNSNPQMEEEAQDVSEAVQKRLQKAQEKENLKRQFLGMLISAGIGQVMGKVGNFISSKTTMDINMNELNQAQRLELYGGLDEDAFAQQHGYGSMKAMMSPQYGAGYFKQSRWTKLGKAIREQRSTADAKRSYGTGGGGGGGQKGGFVSAQGFQAGGAVGRYGVRGFQGGGSVSVNPLSSSSNVNNINITVNTGGSDSSGRGENQNRSVLGSSDEGSQAKELSEKIKARVIAVISDEQRVGGLLSATRRKP